MNLADLPSLRELLPALPAAFRGADTLDPRGKVVLITGAGAGIGRALAEDMSARGASVAVLDIDGSAATATANTLGENAFAIPADVADRAAMREAVARVHARFGRIDVVVANAGVVPEPATIATMDPAEFDRVVAVNLVGVFNTVHPALPHVIDAGGHVVVVSSAAAFAPGMAGSPYMTTKAAVEQFGRALRVELAAVGATAGVAYFGIVDTAMTHGTLDDDELGRAVGRLLPWPLNRRITAREAAASVAEGIVRRAPRTIAPAQWEPYALLRGAINVVLDDRLTRDPAVREVIHRVEARVRAARAADQPREHGSQRARG
ncbi:short-chain dehydrogenase/reductase [Nocardia bovistercoris]|uniref:SDR family NAD(P)-dependent oxidoreductase n=1 Tax=Nocardia bovistercoris TaxID=2785916 RepID=A0A931I6G3_9NOCA|nr:short-chain dehydrogenase/reductase [Nocardia bovistercoris]MBH0774778.1 SDR family NAD(P)-dependent oxidoreductase [Nocardia bovistercoris]